MSTTYSAGVATAYGAAVRGGYTGTYTQWCALMADYAAVEGRAAGYASDAERSAGAADASASAAAVSAEQAASRSYAATVTGTTLIFQPPTE